MWISLCLFVCRREYHYLIPRRFLDTDEKVRIAGEVAKAFEGTHAFHNFTRPSAVLNRRRKKRIISTCPVQRPVITCITLCGR